MTSIISFIVLLLATYSYSAPIVGESKYTTSPVEVENVTIALHGQPDLLNIESKIQKDSAASLSVNATSSESKEDTDKSPSQFGKNTYITHLRRDSKQPKLTTVANDYQTSTGDESLATHMKIKRGMDIEQFESSTGINAEQSESSTGMTERDVTEETASTDISEREVTEETPVTDMNEREVTEETPATDMNEREVTEESVSTDISEREVTEETPATEMNEREVTEETASTDISEREVTEENVSTDISEREVTEETPATEMNEREVTEETPATDMNEREVTEETASTDINEREVTEESVSTDISEREVTEETPATDMNEREVTEETPATEMNEREVTEETASTDINEREVTEESVSTDISEREVTEDTSVSPSSEANNIKRSMFEQALITNEAIDAFNKRAVGPVQSVEVTESSTVVVGESQPEATTSEQALSSANVFAQTAGLIPTEQNNVTQYETTVVPAEDLTTVTSVPSETTRKILKIIPGQISKTEVLVQPTVQEQLSQGQNQSVIAEKKSDN